MGAGADDTALITSLLLPAMDNMASTREISFRRLMYGTEQQLASCKEDMDSNVNATQFSPSLAKLRHCISCLEDQLADLDCMQAALRLSSEKLSLYRQHVKHLASQVPVMPVPLYCVKPVQKTVMPSSLLSSGLAAAVVRSGAGSTGTGHDDSRGGSSGEGGIRRAVLGLSATAEKQIETQKALQDDQTDELVTMTGSLKMSTLALQAAVKARGELVDGAEHAMDKSLATAKQVVALSNEQYKRGSGGFCLTCMILLIVGMVFTGMAVYIKLTYFVGYRGVQTGEQQQQSPGMFVQWTEWLLGRGRHEEF